ncbi:MAG: CHAD domain-containing protein [Pseudomonadota bacterium]
MQNTTEPAPLPSSVEELVAQILSTQARVVRANIPGALAGEDPEHVHDLRVATRRARAALRQFRKVVGKARYDALQVELRWLAQVAGAVRDLDVFGPRLDGLLDQVEEGAGVRRRLHERLRRRRGPAILALEQALRSPRCTTLIDALELLSSSLLHTPPTGLAAQASVQQVRLGLRPVQKLRPHKIPRMPDAALHALRIEVKRARYTCEFFAAVSPLDLQAVRDSLVRMQDVLGDHQDAAVGEAWLRDWLRGLWRSRVQGLERDELFVTAGALIQAERCRLRELRRDFVELAPRCLEVVAGTRAALRVHQTPERRPRGKAVRKDADQGSDPSASS